MASLSVVLNIFAFGAAIAMLVALARRTTPPLASSALLASMFGLILLGKLAEAGSRRDLIFIAGVAIFFVSLAFQSWQATRPKYGGGT